MIDTTMRLPTFEPHDDSTEFLVVFLVILALCVLIIAGVMVYLKQEKNATGTEKTDCATQQNEQQTDDSKK